MVCILSELNPQHAMYVHKVTRAHSLCFNSKFIFCQLQIAVAQTPVGKISISWKMGFSETIIKSTPKYASKNNSK